jgi:HSP20 family protein
MSNLLPEKWSEALERVNDKIGHFLTKVAPSKKQEQSPERITADTLPAFMELGGPLLDMHETPEELIIMFRRNSTCYGYTFFVLRK